MSAGASSVSAFVFTQGATPTDLSYISASAPNVNCVPSPVASISTAFTWQQGGSGCPDGYTASAGQTCLWASTFPATTLTWSCDVTNVQTQTSTVGGNQDSIQYVTVTETQMATATLTQIPARSNAAVPRDDAQIPFTTLPFNPVDPFLTAIFGTATINTINTVLTITSTLPQDASDAEHSATTSTVTETSMSTTTIVQSTNVASQSSRHSNTDRILTATSSASIPSATPTAAAGQSSTSSAKAPLYVIAAIASALFLALLITFIVLICKRNRRELNSETFNSGHSKGPSSILVNRGFSVSRKPIRSESLVHSPQTPKLDREGEMEMKQLPSSPSTPVDEGLTMFHPSETKASSVVISSPPNVRDEMEGRLEYEPKTLPLLPMQFNALMRKDSDEVERKALADLGAKRRAELEKKRMEIRARIEKNAQNTSAASDGPSAAKEPVVDWFGPELFPRKASVKKKVERGDSVRNGGRGGGPVTEYGFI